LFVLAVWVYNISSTIYYVYDSVTGLGRFCVGYVYLSVCPIIPSPSHENKDLKVRSDYTAVLHTSNINAQSTDKMR